MRGLELGNVRVLGGLSRLRFEKKLVAGKRHKMYFLSNEKKEKWIKDYVERETAVSEKCISVTGSLWECL
jgi:hypothetical protein